MPQLAVETFFSQYFWLVTVLLIFYYYTTAIVIPNISEIVKTRTKLSTPLDSSISTGTRTDLPLWDSKLILQSIDSFHNPFKGKKKTWAKKKGLKTVKKAVKKAVK